MMSFLNMYNHAAREYLVIDAINRRLEAQLEEARASHLSEILKLNAIKYLESDEMDVPNDMVHVCLSEFFTHNRSRDSHRFPIPQPGLVEPEAPVEAEPEPLTQSPDDMQE
jgi:hypothetical protein